MMLVSRDACQHPSSAAPAHDTRAGTLHLPILHMMLVSRDARRTLYLLLSLMLLSVSRDACLPSSSAALAHEAREQT